MSAQRISGLVAFILLTSSQTTWAKAPKFVYATEEAAKEADKKKSKVEWKAVAQAGLLMTTGNSSTTTLSSSFQSSRKEGKNKFLLDLSGAFARSAIFVASDDDNDGFVDESELRRITKTTSQSWLVKPRYDRFLNARNSLYVSAASSADEPAGKTFIGSGQLGYSRTLVHGDVHKVTLESGYDFSYEDLVSGDKALSIHSLRVFAGYEGKLSKDTSLAFSTESLFNLNELETKAGAVSPFDDTRFNNKIGLTTSIYGDLSFSFSFLAKYDSDPAPRPKLSLPYADGFRPVADRLDTRTEAALIINFL